VREKWNWGESKWNCLLYSSWGFRRRF